MLVKKAMKRRGFTLLETLIIMAIIAIILLVATANLFAAVERAKQRRTMADLRVLSTAAQAYYIDRNGYPPVGAYSLPPGLTLATSPITTVASYLEPTYVRNLPYADGWHSWFEYNVTRAGNDFVFRSVGRDGRGEANPAYGPTTSFNSDIILCNGAFIQYPEGMQN
jgi:general secretion pathway protein G